MLRHLAALPIPRLLRVLLVSLSGAETMSQRYALSTSLCGGRLAPVPRTGAQSRRAASAARHLPLREEGLRVSCGSVHAAHRVLAAQRRGQHVCSAATTAPPASEGEAAEQPPPSTEAAGTMAYKLVTFYCFTKIDNPRAEVQRHKAFCQARDIRSRIYINEQGINAQLSGKGDDAVEYAKWVTSDPRFTGTRVSVYDSPEHGFPKLRLRYKANLVQLNGGTQHLDLTEPDKRANHLSPDQWKAKLEEREAGAGPPVLLDVRNTYEWDAGRFRNAPRPPTECFRETVEAFSAEGGQLDGVDPDTPIMMYCTGGIRCDVYSAVLKKKGFNNLYTLQGGVQAYLDKYGNDLWDGHLFVFDSRLAMTPDRQPAALAAEPSLKCFCCGDMRAAAPHRNCPNLDCNRLFLVCKTCLEGQEGFCCSACAEAAYKRPALVAAGKHYGRWVNYAEGDAQIASRRGDGRRLRRARRRERKAEIEIQKSILSAAAELGVAFETLSHAQMDAAVASIGSGASETMDDSGTAAKRTRAARIAAAFATLQANGGVIVKSTGAGSEWGEEDSESESESEDEGDEDTGGGKSRHAKQRRQMRDDAAQLLLAAQRISQQ